MAWELALFDVSLEAGADLSAAQFLAVKLDGNGKIVIASTGDIPIGILQDKPARGQAGSVRIIGISKVVAAGDFDVGAVLTAYQGKVKEATIGDYPIGIALEAASAEGEIVTAFILPEKKAL